MQDTLEPSLGAREFVPDKLRSCIGIPDTSLASEFMTVSQHGQGRCRVGPLGTVARRERAPSAQGRLERVLSGPTR